jgi:hypothetical protein
MREDRMPTIRRILLSLIALAAALPASATFHLWAMAELFSNADGSVQFIELRAITGAQEFVAGHTIKASSGGVTHSFTMPSNLPGDSSGKTLLIGTQGFAALGVVTPDFTVPNGFFFQGGGTVDWGEGADVWNHPALPTNGNDSLDRNGNAVTNSPRNFAGQTGTVHLSTPAPAPAVSLSGDTVDFGSVNVGSRSDTKTITLVSSGSAAYRVTALTNTPGNCTAPAFCTGSDFTCNTTCVSGADLAPGSSCNITASFSPSAAGARSTSINLCDNVNGGRSTTLTLKGTGATAGTTETLNIEGLWYAAPANSESGWGVNLTQQGDIVFATWFTYDTDGSGMWLVGSDVRRQAGTNTYTGALYRTTGPAFSSATFDSSKVVVSQVGTVTFSFTDASTGSFTYTVNGTTQTKPITRQVFGPLPTCALGGSAGATPNFQDLWWHAPANSESGWGVNVTHQGDILFVTWFTYDANGKGMWLVGSEVRRTTGNTFSGSLFSTTGPAFNATPFNPSLVHVTSVGTVTLTFSDANNGTFAYTVNGVSQTKPITRQVYSSPTTVCR